MTLLWKFKEAAAGTGSYGGALCLWTVLLLQSHRHSGPPKTISPLLTADLDHRQQSTGWPGTILLNLFLSSAIKGRPIWKDVKMHLFTWVSTILTAAGLRGGARVLARCQPGHASPAALRLTPFLPPRRPGLWPRNTPTSVRSSVGSWGCMRTAGGRGNVH